MNKESINCMNCQSYENITKYLATYITITMLTYYVIWKFPSSRFNRTSITAGFVRRSDRVLVLCANKLQTYRY